MVKVFHVILEAGDYEEAIMFQRKVKEAVGIEPYIKGEKK